MTQVLTDSHCLRAIPFIVEYAGDPDTRLDASSLAVKVETTLSQFKEPEVSVLTVLECGQRLQGLLDVEAAFLTISS